MSIIRQDDLIQSMEAIHEFAKDLAGQDWQDSCGCERLNWAASVTRLFFVRCSTG